VLQIKCDNCRYVLTCNSNGVTFRVYLAGSHAAAVAGKHWVSWIERITCFESSQLVSV